MIRNMIDRRTLKGLILIIVLIIILEVILYSGKIFYKKEMTHLYDSIAEFNMDNNKTVDESIDKKSSFEPPDETIFILTKKGV